MADSAEPDFRPPPPSVPARNPYVAPEPPAPAPAPPEATDIAPGEPKFDDPVFAGETETVHASSYGLSSRQRKVCLLYVCGKSYAEISKATGYRVSYLGPLLAQPAMKAEIAFYRDASHDEDVLTRLKALNTRAVDHLEKVMLTGTDKEKTAAAQWLLEKTTGKARQETTHDIGGLATYLEAARRLESLWGNPAPRHLAAPDRQVIDVTPGEPVGRPDDTVSAQKDEFTEWIEREL